LYPQSYRSYVKQAFDTKKRHYPYRGVAFFRIKPTACLARPSEYRVTQVEFVGKIRELRKEARLLCSQQASALPTFNSPEYSPDIAAHSAIGLGNPSSHATALPS
jgi:hypothetical protein